MRRSLLLSAALAAACADKAPEDSAPDTGATPGGSSWCVAVGDAEDDRLFDLAGGADGPLFAVGYSERDDDRDGLLALLDGDQLTWRRLTLPGRVELRAVTPDPAGGAWAVGEQRIDGSRDLLLAHVDDALEVDRTLVLEREGEEVGRDLTWDPEAGVLRVTGAASGLGCDRLMVSVDPETEEATWDVVVAEGDQSGWAIASGGGELYLLGSTDADEGGDCTTLGRDDVVLERLSGGQWSATTLESSGADIPYDLIYVEGVGWLASGTTYGDLGEGVGEATGGADAWLLSIPSEGVTRTLQGWSAADEQGTAAVWWQGAPHVVGHASDGGPTRPFVMRLSDDAPAYSEPLEAAADWRPWGAVEDDRGWLILAGWTREDPSGGGELAAPDGFVCGVPPEPSASSRRR